MSGFDDLFGGLGAYAAIVQAHLQIKADEGNETAKALLNGRYEVDAEDPGPTPGDVLLVGDVVFVWDSSDGTDWQWWSPGLRRSYDPDQDGDENTVGVQKVVWHGHRQMPEAATELFDAITWALTEMQICALERNPKTNATYYKASGIRDVSDLVERYRDAAVEPIAVE